MSDIALTASIDFTEAGKQTDAFVGAFKKKMSDIMAQATKAGGSLSSAGTRAGSGSNSAYVNGKAGFDAVSEAKRKFDQLNALERAFADASIGWQRKVQTERERTIREWGRSERDEMGRISAAQKERGQESLNFDKAVNDQRKRERQSYASAIRGLLDKQADDERSHAAFLKAEAERVAAVRKDKAAESANFEAAQTEQQKRDRQSYTAFWVSTLDKMEAAEKGYTQFLKEEQDARLAAEKRAADARTAAEKEAAARSKASAQEYTNWWKNTLEERSRAEILATERSAQAQRNALQASRKMMVGAAGNAQSGYYTPKDINEVISKETDGGTGNGQNIRAFYEKQATQALAAEEKAREEVRRAEAKTASDLAKSQTDAAQTQEKAKTDTVRVEAEERTRIRKAEAAEQAAWEKFNRQDASRASMYATQDAAMFAGNKRDIRAQTTVDSRALGMNDRISRQVNDPRLAEDLGQRVSSSAGDATRAIRMYGADSMEATKALAAWKMEAQAVSGEIVKHNGLFKQLAQNTDTLRGSIEKAGAGFGGFRRVLLNTQVALATFTAVLGFREIVNAMQELETFKNTMAAVSPTAQDAAKNIEFLRNAGEAIGFSYLETGKAFSQFAAAAYATGATTDQVQQVFLRVTAASRNLGLSSADTEGVIRALTQSMSKGRFAAEEMRQQLGDRLPIAMAALKTATGKSGQELEDMMKKGLVTTSQFMIPFVEAMFNMSGGMTATERSSMSLMAQLGRMKNAFTDLVEFAAKGSFTEGLTKGIAAVTALLTGDFAKAFVDVFGQVLERAAKGIVYLADAANTYLAPALRLVGDNLAIVEALVVGLATRSLAAMALGAVSSAAGWVTLQGGIMGAARAMVVFTAASLTNPVVALAAVIASAAAALYYYKDSLVEVGGNSARVWDIVVSGAVYAWELMKEFGAWVADGFSKYWASSIEAIGRGWTALVNGAASAMDKVIGFFKALPEIANIVGQDISAYFVAMGTNIGNFFKTALANITNMATGAGAALAAGFSAIKSGNFSGAAEEMGKAWGANMGSGLATTFETTTVTGLSTGRIGEVLRSSGSTAATDFVAGFGATMGDIAATVTTSVTGAVTSAQTALTPAMNTIMAGAAERTRAWQAQQAEAAKRQAITMREMFGALGGTFGKSDPAGPDKKVVGVINAVREALEDLERQAERSGVDGGAAQAYASAFNKIEDAASRAGIKIDSTAAVALAAIAVAKKLQKEYALFVVQSNRAAKGSELIADGYLQSAEAGQAAEIRVKAMTEAMRFVVPTTDSAGNATGAYKDKIEELIPVLTRVETAQKNANAARQVSSNRDEIEYLKLEASLITSNADAREKELAALKARQQFRGADAAKIKEAEETSRQLVEQKNVTDQLTNSWQELSKIGEQAFDRIGTAITEAFTKGKGKMIDFKNIAKAVFSEIIQAALKMMVINPILNSLFGGTRGTAGGLMTVLGSAGGDGAGGVAGGGSSGGMSMGGLSSMFSLGKSADGMTGGFIGKSFSDMGDSMGLTGAGGFFSTGNSVAAPSISGMSSADALASLPGMSQSTTGLSGLQSATSAAGLGTNLASIGGGALGIAGGAYGVYSGIQKGGIGGAVGALGGAASMVGGGLMLGGAMGMIGPALLALGPYGLIAGAALALISSFLPGAKPSNKTGTAALDIASGGIDVYGQTGSKMSSENRAAANTAVGTIKSTGDAISKLLGDAKLGGRATVDYGNRDGIGFNWMTRSGENTGTFHTTNDEAGQKQMFNYFTAKMLEDVAETLPKALRDGVAGMDRSDSTTALTNLAKLAQATNGGKPSDDQNKANIDWSNFDSGIADLTWIKDVFTPLQDAKEPATEWTKQMDALNAQWQPLTDKAAALGLETGKLAEAWAKAIQTAEVARQAAIDASDANLHIRSLRATGQDAAADFASMDLQIAQEQASFRATLEGWGMSATDVAAHMTELYKVQGEEQLALVKTYSDKETAIQEQAAAQAQQAAEQAAQAWQTATGSAANNLSSIRDYILGLRTSDKSPLSATAQYDAASRDFNSILGSAMGGDATSATKLTSYADTFLNASSAVNGTGAGFASDFNKVVDALGQYASQSDEQLTAPFYAAQMQTQTATLQEELVLLREEVTALRGDVRQNGNKPARAA